VIGEILKWYFIICGVWINATIVFLCIWILLGFTFYDRNDDYFERWGS
jgi:hypothetical protein